MYTRYEQMSYLVCNLSVKVIYEVMTRIMFSNATITVWIIQLIITFRPPSVISIILSGLSKVYLSSSLNQALADSIKLQWLSFSSFAFIVTADILISIVIKVDRYIIYCKGYVRKKCSLCWNFWGFNLLPIAAQRFYESFGVFFGATLVEVNQAVKAWSI